VADEIADLYVLLSARTSEFQKDMAGAGLAADETSGKLAGVGKAAIALGAVVAGAGIGIGVYALKAADDLDAATKKLNAAQQAAGINSASMNGEVEKANATMEKYGVTNATTEGAIATLVEAHVPLNEQLQVLQGAENLASAKGLDLQESLKMVLLAAQGSGRALKEYGVNLPATIDTTKQLDNAQASLAKAQEKLTKDQADSSTTAKQLAKDHDAVAAAQQKVTDITQNMANHFAALPQTLDALSIFNGQAEAHADTLAGKVDHLKAQVTDDAAKMGQALTPLAEGGLSTLSNTVLPDVEKAFEWMGTTGVRDLGQVGSAVAPVAGFFGGELLNGGKFLVDHAGILEEVFSIWAARMVTIKALDMANWMRSFVIGFDQMQQGAGKFSAVMSTFGMGGSNSLGFKMQQLRGETQMTADLLAGRYVMAAESAASATTAIGTAAETAVAGEAAQATETAITATEGWASKLASVASFAIPGIGIAAGLLAPIVISHWSDITGAFESSDQKLQDLKKSLSDTNSAASSGLTDSLTGSANAIALSQEIGGQATGTLGYPQQLADRVKQIKDLNQQLKDTIAAIPTQDLNATMMEGFGGGFAVPGKSDSNSNPDVQAIKAKIAALQIPSDIVQNWDTFGSTTQVVLTRLSSGKNVDTTGINEFMAALKKSGGDADAALALLGTTGDANLQLIQKDLKDTAAIRWDSTISSYQQLIQQLANAGMTTDQATAKAKQFYPNVDQATKSLQHEADQLTGGNVPALQALIQNNPTLVQQMKDQADAAQAAAQQAANLATNWDGLLSRQPALAAAIGDATAYSHLAGRTSVANLLGHAAGGYFTTPHVAMVAEGGEGESIVPDSKLAPVVARVMAMSGGGGGGGGINIGTVIVQANDIDQLNRQLRKAALQRAKSSGTQHQYGSLA
jgi:hypothetical protein